MRKVGILIIVALLAVSGIMAAMAYTEATVWNQADMTIINTDKALVGLYPWADRVGTKDKTVYIDENDGRLYFNFAAGYGDQAGQGTKGFQPGSVYKWGQLFRVYNRSNDNVEFTIENDGLKYIYVSTFGYIDYSPTSKFVFVHNGENTGNRISIPPGAQQAISVKFVVPDDAAREAISGNLIVKSWAK